jgi:hypothetical protein
LDGERKSAGERQAARHSVWRHRGRRVTTGLNVAVSLALAATVFLLVNLLAQRWFFRHDTGAHGYYRLSPRTRTLIANLREPVDVVSFFRRDPEAHGGLYSDVQQLLREYAYAALESRPQRLNVRVLDPDRELAETRELAERFHVRQPNVIVAHCAGRTKRLDARDLARVEEVLEGRSQRQRLTQFYAERLLSSAILGVAEGSEPLVLFLEGHRERSIEDFSDTQGLSKLAAEMRRDHMDVARLTLEPGTEVPTNCAALVIAGARLPVVDSELAALRRYLERGGRLMVLLENARPAGIEDLLAEWGLQVADGVVCGFNTPGGEVAVGDFDERHPAVRDLQGLRIRMHKPRSVFDAGGGAAVEVDRPRVTELAFSARDSSWLETDPAQQPPRFDAEADIPGPLPVAACAERGAGSGPSTGLRPTRIVVVGDADFVVNGELRRGAAGKVDFFLASMNWLVEREAWLAITPKTPQDLLIDMDAAAWNRVYLWCAGVLPAAVLLLGLAAWAIRRR